MKKQSNIDNIRNVQKQIHSRISDISRKINNIDSQLLHLEKILSDLQDKIEYYDKSNKDITKSKLMRWYLEDLKIYNELNTIRIKYEELLVKYSDQLIDSNVKLEELHIKISKIDAENTSLQKVLEDLEKKMQERDEGSIPINVNFEEKFQI